MDNKMKELRAEARVAIASFGADCGADAVIAQLANIGLRMLEARMGLI